MDTPHTDAAADRIQQAMMTRRGFAKDAVTFVVVATTAGPSRYALAKKDVLAPLAGIFAKIEADSGGRLGVEPDWCCPPVIVPTSASRCAQHAKSSSRLRL